MNLSEAIRLGAMLKPQWFGTMRSSDGSASCAIGAAIDAGWTYHFHPALSAVCPVCTRPHELSLSTPAHLNDRHRWTREQIADWVETIEAQQALVPIPEDAHVVPA